MSELSAETVVWAYRILLDREPEDEQAIITKCRNLGSIEDLRREIMNSEEYRNKTKQRQWSGQSPFFHYASTFDALELMHRYAANPVERPGYLVNFLGVAIDPKFFPSILQDRAGQVEGIPIPANWHADIAEWGAALRAVDLSGDRFVVAELGCGWGCWMNNTGLAARSTGKLVKVIGIEGDAGHIEFAREALAVNGFDATQIELYRGIATSEAGVALFPTQQVPGSSWGSEPIFGATEAQREQALASGQYEEITMIPLSEVIASESRIDLLHVDIQGGEADLVEQTLKLLNEKIAYLLIGTHSKEIEGRLYNTLLEAGWHLEMERAAIFDIIDGRPQVRVDGVQGWRNPLLQPMEKIASAVAE